MADLPDGTRRITLPLPVGPGHVHCYLLPGPDGWTLVDTGLGLPDAEEAWARELAGVEVARIFVTHFHPDHVGGAEAAARATGAPVLQGAVDRDQCLRVWGTSDWPDRIAAWFRRNGVPGEIVDELQASDELARGFIRYSERAQLVQPDDQVDGWRAVHLPGHADGHLCLLRDGVLIAGDHLLGEITPAIGVYPDTGRDPLGAYQESLARTIAVAPRVALPGHGEPIEQPVARAREILAHHEKRLETTHAALRSAPGAVTGYEVALAVFGHDLSPSKQRFATAEALAHLERLLHEGRAAKADDGSLVTYNPR